VDRMKIHPACLMLPPLPPKAFADLRASVKAIGLVAPILTAPDGSILDGKNRYHACEREKVTPRFEKADLRGMDPIAWVLEVNRHRIRNSSQLALAGARLVTGTHGGDRHSEAFKSANCGLELTRAAAAARLNISAAAIDRAQFILEHGVPELVSYVEYGEVPLGPAFDVAHMSRQDQLACCAIDGKAVRVAARVWREKKLADHTSVAIEPSLKQLLKTTRRLDDVDRRTALDVILRATQAEIAALPKAKSAA